jgi:hypothetical protein
VRVCSGSRPGTHGEAESCARGDRARECGGGERYGLEVGDRVCRGGRGF